MSPGTYLAILMLLAIWGARVMWQVVSYRRRVRARLLALIDRDNRAVENRLYRRGKVKPAWRVESTGRRGV